MPWRGPEYEGEFPSLGWALLDFCSANFTIPSGPHTGKPLILTDEQASFVVRFYRLDDRGRFIYRRAAQRRSKGWGKSPEAAALALGEFIGPVRFGGWDARGEPVGIPVKSPWVQVAACSEDQTANTYSALYEMMRESPAVEEYAVDVGITRMFLRGRAGRLEPVTAAAGSREGQLVTFAVMDETHLWTHRNGGKRLAETIRDNATKVGGRTFETTNAYIPGHSSVAEATHKAWEKGARGVLYDCVEAPEVLDLMDSAALRAALEIAYGDSTWVDLDRIVDDIQDPATEAGEARRKFLNQVVAGEKAAIDPRQWDVLSSDADVFDGERIALGFDGSLSEDSTALIACTADGHLFVPVVDGEPTIWERPEGVREWRVPHLAVEDAVAKVMARWSVGRMFCDPPKWTTEIERWAQSWGDERVLFFDTNQPKRMAGACDRLAQAVRGNSCTHDGNLILRAHIVACARQKAYVRADEDDGRTLYTWVKADTRKIDAGIAAVLAYEAAMTMPTDEETDISQHIW